MVMVPSCVRTFLTRLLIFDTPGGSLGLAPARGWHAYDSPEGSVEGRFGIVADSRGDLTETQRTFAQQPSRKMHPPASWILHWCLTDEFDETFCKRCSRCGGALCQFVDRPRACRLSVK
jgi:hypothetical protein